MEKVAGDEKHEKSVSASSREPGDVDRSNEVVKPPPPPPPPPRTRSAARAEKKRMEDEMKENESSNGEISVRRSNRDFNSIRLKGTAPTFYRRLHTLFFSPSSHKGFESFGGNRIQMKRLHKKPPIYVIDNFLSASELEYFDEKIASCPFEKSFVDNMQYEENNKADDNNNTKNKRRRRTMLDTSHRTSTFFGFKKLHDTKVAALEQRIADLLGCWVHQIEALQLVRYMPGQFFGIHHDMGDLLGDDEVILPQKQLGVKRRLVTLFCYLNNLDKDQGGCTYFPQCDLRVRPKKGRAVLFSNVTSAGLPDPYTIHAGEAVESNNKSVVKYGLNIWICEE